MGVAKPDEGVGEVQFSLHTNDTYRYVRDGRAKSLLSQGEEMNMLNTNVRDTQNKMTNVPSNSCTAIMMRVPGGALSLNQRSERSMSSKNQQVSSHCESNRTDEKCHR